MICGVNLAFKKYCATGNSFLVFDNRWKRAWTTDIEALCQTEGVDGILILEESTQCDFMMRIINSDGAEVDMCGNGLRVITHFAHYDLFMPQKSFTVETRKGIYKTWILEEKTVKVKMTEFYDWMKYPVPDGFYLNTGVPHCVLFVDNLEELDLEAKGKQICFNPTFQGQTNVNFIQIGHGQKSASLRTYERGVYGETLSCGTGAVACAIVLSKKLGWFGKIFLKTPGGRLIVELDQHFKDIFLSGKVERLIND
jgi:diaminopimelate epimerase